LMDSVDNVSRQDIQRITLNASYMMISGGRTEQLDIIAGLLPHHWLYECYSSIPLSPPIRPTCPAFQVICLGLPTS